MGPSLVEVLAAYAGLVLAFLVLEVRQRRRGRAARRREAA
jgi:hypothetical protein